jgi:hypothetical protein
LCWGAFSAKAVSGWMREKECMLFLPLKKRQEARLYRVGPYGLSEYGFHPPDVDENQ